MENGNSTASSCLTGRFPVLYPPIGQTLTLPRFGTYSTDAAIKAGLDLEMPSPTHWRGVQLQHAVDAGKIEMSDIDARVRAVLQVSSPGPGMIQNQSLTNPSGRPTSCRRGPRTNRYKHPRRDVPRIRRGPRPQPSTRSRLDRPPEEHTQRPSP